MWRIFFCLEMICPENANGEKSPALWFRLQASLIMYRRDRPPYRPSRVLVYHCFPTSLSQGELYIIEDNNDIFYLPCGDLCEEAEIPTDDDPVSYTYLGCYADNSNDRIFSGNFIQQYAEMTTEEVSRDWAWGSSLFHFMDLSLEDFDL